MFDVKDTDFFDMEDAAFDTIVENDIAFTGSIKMNSTSDLVIDSDAVVNADITAERVLIRGKVKGNIIGNKLIFITASGSLDGDITTAKVVLEPGCVFTGKCSMVNNGEK